MPLLDHFQGSLRRRRHWKSFHSSWATFIAMHLNRGVLPKNCVAEVHVSLGVQLEAEATADQEHHRDNGSEGATANKDRPDSRRAFASTCLAYLHQGVGVVVVDVVTERTANLHAELCALLGRDAGVSGNLPLYVAAYRTVTRRQKCRLQAWAEPLALQAPLPIAPLWIDPAQAIPLDLEPSYLATCEALLVSA